MINKNFILQNFKEFKEILDNASSQIDKLASISNLILNLKKRNTIHIFGNGGSASIASHFSMDLTNNSNIKCLNYNDPAIITCYANDFGFENWISRAILKYGNKNDILILISSSGTSKNMINGLKSAQKKNFSSIITFTGFKKKNYLSDNSDFNFWIDSKKYNLIENAHQFYLLTIVDLIKFKLK